MIDPSFCNAFNPKTRPHEPDPDFPAAIAQKLALVVAGSIAALLLFLWLALPGIIQSQAEKFIREKSGHRLTLDRPQFNPFSLSCASPT